MKNELREKGRGADRAADGRSRHAVLRCLAGRGGDSAEQSNQIMSGVCGHWVKSFQAFHRPCPASGAGFRRVATLLTNLHLPNFLKGGLYQGAGKTVCVPGLNCYSCPAASGACPIGAFQAVVGSSKFSFSYYITGFLILLGVLLGRFICGFLCPFGWFQELLHKIPTKKLSTKKAQAPDIPQIRCPAGDGFLLPAFLVNDVGMGDPFFCKYLCPQGVLEGAIPLSLANSGIRAALGKLFTWKFSILLSVIVLSVVFYRPFCKWLCPLGAFYALFNRVSLFQMKVDKSKCVSCGKCARACKMDVDVTKRPTIPSASGGGWGGLKPRCGGAPRCVFGDGQERKPPGPNPAQKPATRTRGRKREGQKNGGILAAPPCWVPLPGPLRCGGRR